MQPREEDERLQRQRELQWRFAGLGLEFAGGITAFVLVGLAFLATALAPAMLRDHLSSILRRAMAARRETILARVEIDVRREDEIHGSSDRDADE